MKRIGTVTIGQSPRVDIVPELLEMLGSDAEIVEKGALDGLSAEQVAAMAPTEQTEVLVTRLADGSSVTISDEAVIPRVQKCIDELQGEVSSILLLCTGTFPPLQSQVPVLVPEHLLLNFVRGITGSKPLHLGVLTPDEGQFPQQEKRWASFVARVVLRAASPYESLSKLKEEAAKFATDGVDAVVLDCMGYTAEMKQILQEVLPCPVILSRSVLARFAAELA